MLITGACVNGSNPIISAAVSADLVRHCIAILAAVVYVYVMMKYFESLHYHWSCSFMSQSY